MAKGCFVKVTTPTGTELVSGIIERGEAEQIVKQMFSGKGLAGVDISQLVALAYAVEADDTTGQVSIQADIQSLPTTAGMYALAN